MESNAFQIGDIVALKSHHFSSNYTNIIYCGDPMLQSPLMVIVEILCPKADDKIKKPEIYHYKCLWYSTKSQHFEESWFLEPLIKLIKGLNDRISELLPLGSTVIFRTLPLEIQKQKSSFTIENKGIDGDIKISTITPLLSFISPVLLICGYGEEKSEVERKDKEERRIKEIKQLKVKWFNIQGEKFSEVFLPESCLIELPKPDEKKLTTIQLAINNKQYLKIYILNRCTFIKPLQLIYLNGFYFLRYFDVLLGRMDEDIEINKIEILSSVPTPFEKTAPVFDFSKSKLPVEEVVSLIKKSKRKKKIIRIKYTNQYGVNSIRCVKDFSVHKGFEGTDAIEYLTGYCFLKSGERHFNIRRIKQLKMLDLKWSETNIVTI